MLKRSPVYSSLLVAGLCTIVLGGCVNLAPDYARPSMPVPTAWPTGPAYRQADLAASSSEAKAGQAFFRDERLGQVIALALDNNRDLRQAVATVDAARATYRIQRSDLFPSLDASGSGSRGRSYSASSNRTSFSKSYEATAGLSSYEIDLFGRVRNLTDASRESWLASEATMRSTRITVIAETATAWLTLAADLEQLALSKKTMESAQRSTELTRRRNALGVASLIDVREAETVYLQAKADVASYTTVVAQDRNALELLVGKSLPENLLPSGMATPDEAANWLAEIRAGLPSEVLLDRPDVLAAEHSLKAANANIGAARAKYFPSLSLTAAGGVASSALSSLFSGGATVWSMVPSVSLPLLDAGAHQGNVDYAKAEKDVSLAQYESAVQTAFREVSDALARRGTIHDQLAAQQDLVKAAKERYMLADARYTRGVDTYLNALDAQRTLYSAEQSLISTRLTELENRVTLFRTLGAPVADQVIGKTQRARP